MKEFLKEFSIDSVDNSEELLGQCINSSNESLEEYLMSEETHRNLPNKFLNKFVSKF